MIDPLARNLGAAARAMDQVARFASASARGETHPLGAAAYAAQDAHAPLDRLRDPVMSSPGFAQRYGTAVQDGASALRTMVADSNGALRHMSQAERHDALEIAARQARTAAHTFRT